MRKFTIYCILCLIIFTMISCNSEEVQDNVDWRIFPVEYIEPYFPFSEFSRRTFVSDQGDKITYIHLPNWEYSIWRERIFSTSDVFGIDNDESYSRILSYKSGNLAFTYNLNVTQNRNILDINFDFSYKNYHIAASQVFNNPTPENPNNIFSFLTDTIELYQSDVLSAKIVKYEGPVWFITHITDESDNQLQQTIEWYLEEITSY